MRHRDRGKHHQLEIPYRGGEAPSAAASLPLAMLKTDAASLKYCINNQIVHILTPD